MRTCARPLRPMGQPVPANTVTTVHTTLRLRQHPRRGVTAIQPRSGDPRHCPQSTVCRRLVQVRAPAEDSLRGLGNSLLPISCHTCRQRVVLAVCAHTNTDCLRSRSPHPAAAKRIPVADVRPLSCPGICPRSSASHARRDLVPAEDQAPRQPKPRCGIGASVWAGMRCSRQTATGGRRRFPMGCPGCGDHRPV